MLYPLSHTNQTMPFSLVCDAGHFGKVWSAGGQHEIQYTQWRMNNYTYDYMYNFTLYLSYISCSQNLMIIIRNIYKKKWNSQHRIGCNYSNTLLQNQFFFSCGTSARFRFMASSYRASRSHSLGLLWMSDQPDAETTDTHNAHKTDILAAGGIRTRNNSKQAAADPRLRPRGHRDRHNTGYKCNTHLGE